MRSVKVLLYMFKTRAREVSASDDDVSKANLDGGGSSIGVDKPFQIRSESECVKKRGSRVYALSTKQVHADTTSASAVQVALGLDARRTPPRISRLTITSPNPGPLHRILH